MGYQRSGSLNCTASTSQFLLDIDQLIAELEKSQCLYCIQQHYGCIVAIARGRQRAILVYEISWFLFDFPVISLKNDVICCKSGWGWRVGLISELDFKELCFDFSWFQLDFNWFLHEVYEISFVADPSVLLLRVLTISWRVAETAAQFGKSRDLNSHAFCVILTHFTCNSHFSFSYSLITKSKYGLLKGVLILVIVNQDNTSSWLNQRPELLKDFSLKVLVDIVSVIS